ncbi:MAG: dipeptide ABC transporter ATP-binding protein [Negativicutes bacterium]|nr:dipeptide ABC transporter ATP-binding protein [Negativicutes bacterium]
MAFHGGQQPLLEVKNLKQYYPIKGGLLGRTVKEVKAVDGISFSVYPGETLGVVGESGCGKSTTGRSILRLEEPTEGSVFYRGINLLELSKDEMRKMRKDIQIIFQDPFASLNPRRTVGQTLEEALAIAKVVPANDRRIRALKLMEQVGLRPDQIDRYPHEFSGGQRQRICIARALAVEPQLIVCDEAVSALDVSIQAQVLNLLKDLQNEYDLTYLFISHDLGVVHHITDRVMVMYLGKVVELAETDALFANPRHPYTQALLSAIPSLDRTQRKERIILQGDVPSPIDPPSGCRFHTRCPYAMDICRQEEPLLREMPEAHFVACHLV